MTENTEASAAEAKPVKRGVGVIIKEAILAGKTNEEALAAALAEIPTASTSVATVSWYRNDLRKHGHVVPTAREILKAQAAAAAAPKEADPLA